MLNILMGGRHNEKYKIYQSVRRPGTMKEMNLSELGNKHENILKLNGLNIIPSIEDQKIIYHPHPQAYQSFSTIPQIEKIEKLEEKLKNIESDRFNKIECKDVGALVEEIREIEGDSGDGAFKKILKLKYFYNDSFHSGVIRDEKVNLYLLDNGTGIYFGDKTRLPESNIELIDGGNTSELVRYLVGKKIIREYSNGVDFNEIMILAQDPKYFPNMISEMFFDQWGTEKIKELERAVPKIKDICFTDKNRKIVTIGEFGNAISRDGINAYDATNFHSAISAGDIKLRIPKDYFLEGKKVCGPSCFSFIHPSEYATVGDSIEFNRLRDWVLNHEENNKTISFPNPKDFIYAENEYVASVHPRILSRGKINIECASPDVLIIHPGMKAPRQSGKYQIYAFSEKGKVKVKYTCRRKA